MATISTGCSLTGQPRLNADPSASVQSPQPLAADVSYDSSRFPNIAVDHIVIVVEENHSYKQIIGSSNAPYMSALIHQGALFTNAYAITHPSEPNYLALFSGSTQGIKDDSCNKRFKTNNLGSELLNAKLTFTGYSEDLPKVGFTGCWAGGYGRKHNPWVQFTSIPAKSNQPFSAFPKDYAKLPTVSFVIPNHRDDMHDGTVKEADDWLKQNIGPYASWAMKHRSLLIVIWDEDDNSKKNQIPVIMAGSMVRQGKYAQKINHYNVLRTIEDLYGLPRLGASSTAEPITDVWK